MSDFGYYLSINFYGFFCGDHFYLRFPDKIAFFLTGTERGKIASDIISPQEALEILKLRLSKSKISAEREQQKF